MGEERSGGVRVEPADEGSVGHPSGGVQHSERAGAVDEGSGAASDEKTTLLEQD